MSLTIGALVGVAAAVTKLALRSQGLGAAADAVDDSRAGWVHVRNLGKSEGPVSQTIEAALSRRLAGYAGTESGEFRAAASDVEDLLNRLAESEDAIYEAAIRPDRFYQYAMANGGSTLLGRTSDSGSPLFTEILASASKVFAAIARTSPQFASRALAQTATQVEILPTIAADARSGREAAQRTEALVQLASKRSQAATATDVVAAHLRATPSEAEPVVAWRRHLGIHPTITVRQGQRQIPDELTAYIPRNHDEHLRRAVASLIGPAAGGRSGPLTSGFHRLVSEWACV